MEYNLRYSNKNDQNINMHMHMNMNVNMNMNMNMNMTMTMNINDDFSDINEFTETVQADDYNKLSNVSTNTNDGLNNTSLIKESTNKGKSSTNINIYDWNGDDLYNNHNHDLTVELNEIIKLYDSVIKRDFCDHGSKQVDSDFNSFNCDNNYEIVQEKTDVIVDHNPRHNLNLSASSNVKNGVLSCSYCNKLFTRKSDLSSHIRTHSIIKPFKCPICSKSFARHSDLKRHKSIHFSCKKIQCKGILGNGRIWGCGNFYSRSDGLRKHLRSRSGKKCISELIGEINFEHAGDIEDTKNQTDYLSKALQNTRLFGGFTDR